MLCAGVVHGDLSDFNVLLASDGPVIIDFPQAIDAAHNRNARQMLIRDVDNLTRFLARYCSKLRKRRYQGYGTEMWTLYERGALTPETRLTGKKPKPTHTADAMSLLEEIESIQAESRKRREELGLPPRRPARQPTQSKRSPRPVDEARDAPDGGGRKRKRKRKRRKKKADDGSAASAPAPKPASPPADLDPLDDLDALLSIED